MAVNIGQTVIPALMLEGQALVIESELVKHSGVEVMNRDLALGDAVAEVIGLAVDQSRFDKKYAGLLPSFRL